MLYHLSGGRLVVIPGIFDENGSYCGTLIWNPLEDASIATAVATRAPELRLPVSRAVSLTDLSHDYYIIVVKSES